MVKTIANPLVLFVLFLCDFVNANSRVYQFPLEYEIYGMNPTYFSKIAIGNPPQTTKVIFNTNICGVVSVPEKDCMDMYNLYNNETNKESHCYTEKFLYDPNASTTNIKTGLFCDLNCTQNGGIGEWMKDSFVIGDPSDPKHSLQLKSQVSFVSQRYILFPFHLIIGMAICDKNNNSNLFQSAWKDGLLDKPVYNIYQRTCDKDYCENGGLITLGGEDLENCEPIGEMQKLHFEEELHLNKIEVNRITFADQNNSIFEMSTQSININFGNKLDKIMVPMRIILGLYKFLGINNENIYETVYMPCDSKFNLILEIQNQKLVIQSKDLLEKNDDVESGLCILKIIGISHESDIWSIGVPFAVSYCSLFNMENNTIGFGKVKNYTA